MNSKKTLILEKERLERMIEQNPKDTFSISALAMIYQHLIYPVEESIALLEKGLIQVPYLSDLERHRLYNNLGYFYCEELGNIPKAMHYFRKSIEESTVITKNYYGLGKFYYEQQDYLEALPLFLAAYKHNHNPNDYLSAAVCHYYLGNYRESIAILADCYRIKPSPAISFTYAGILAMDRQSEKARSILLAMSHNAMVEIGLEEIADIYYLLDQYEAVIIYYDMVNNLYLSADWLMLYWYALKVAEPDRLLPDYEHVRCEVLRELEDEKQSDDWDSKSEHLQYIKKQEIRLYDIEEGFYKVISECNKPNYIFTPHIWYGCYYEGCTVCSVD